MKKILFLIAMAIGLVNLSLGQEWLENLPKNKNTKDFTLYDYQNAFDQYWAPYNVNKNGYYIEDGKEVKAPGWKQFKRWYWNMESKVDPETGSFPVKTAQEVYNEFIQANPNQRNNRSANWTELGPGNSDGGYAGVGRLNCIAFHPSDPNTYWVGAPAGGLWMTTNNGNSWTCLTDNNNVLGVSDIGIPSDYASSQTIYIATGDKDAFDNRSIGVLKTTDGGSTWNTTGLQYSLAQGRKVTRLLIDPNNNDHIIAATSVGVYETTNGGDNWSNQLISNSFIDMEYKPGDFNTLYGSTTNGSIYVSSNGGSNWTESFDQGNRVELAVSPANSNYVYALVVNSSSALYGVYRSTNSGASFTLMYNNTNLLGWASDGSGNSGQGWYDLALAVSPNNANTLVVGGVNTWRSTDGGTHWNIVNHWWGDGVPAVHADKHMLKYRSNGDLFECNDGGVYFSSNNGTTWTDKTNGIVISQMYKLGVSQSTSNETITGLQDNGTKLINNGIWDDVKGGDGMECLIDYTDANIQYGTYVNGQISRTTNHWASSTAIEPGGAGSGAWVTPYIIDPVDHNTLYAGYADVWKTTNKGNTWTKISTINTGSKIRAMAISESDNDVIYISDPNDIWKTTNGGSSWTNINGNLPLSNSNLNYIAVKSDDPNTLWVALSGYNSNNVYQSINGGSTWTNISSGLPQMPCYTIIQNTQVSGSVHLYVGTELGVYFKNGANSWVEYNNGLPNVQCGELEIYYASNPADSKLRLASYGRGLWESNLELENGNLATVQTSTPTNITTTTANLGGNVTDEGSSNVSERGVVWSSSPNPTINDNKIVDSGTGTGNYTVPVSGLNPSTSYYCKAYAINNVGTAYGTQQNFTTNSNAPTPVANVSATAGCATGSVTVTSDLSGTQTFYLTDNSGTVLDNTTINATFYEFDGLSDGVYRGKVQNNGQMSSLSSPVTLTNINIPSQPSNISGEINPCQGETQTYTVANVSGVDYLWTLPSGWTGSSTTNTITVTVGPSSGNISVIPSNICGNGNQRTLAVSVNNIPDQPSAISGATNPCEGDTETYTVSEVAGVNYLWSLPSDWSGSSNANSITVTIGASSGNVTVIPSNSCGNGISRVLAVSVNHIPDQPSAITGETNLCEGDSETYTVTNVTGVNYNWTLPADWSGSSTSNSISVSIGSASGVISVTPSNGCGNGIASTLGVTVNSIPSQPAEINGNTAVCEGTQETYSVPVDTNVDSYSWIIPNGWSGSSTSNTIIVTVGSEGGNIKAIPSNSCGTGPSQTLALLVTNSGPPQPGEIQGDLTVCSGGTETYSVPDDVSVDTYNWTLPSGWTGYSNDHSITVTVGNTGGTISVYPSNLCGDGPAQNIAVDVSSATPTSAGPISGPSDICEGTTQTYSVTSEENIEYTWLLPSGWTGSSQSNEITVIVGPGSGEITVIPVNGCGAGPQSSLSVNVNTLPEELSAITGEEDPCVGTTQTYSVIDQSGVQYNWLLPDDWTGSSTSNTIIVTVGSSNGNISVNAQNECGVGPNSSLMVDPVETLGSLGDISGPSNIMETLEGEFIVNSAIDADSYQWTVSSNWEILNGQGTYKVNVQFPAGAESGILSVTAQNQCGESEPSLKNIEVMPVGIEDLSSSMIQVYPNPSQGYITIELENPLTQDADVKIWSMDGKIIHQIIFSMGSHSLQLDLKNLAPGNYFLNLENDHTNQKFKIVITK